MTAALLTVRRIRAAEFQRAGAAVGEGIDRRRSSAEQEVEQRDGVGDVDVVIPVRVERGHATRLGCLREQPVEGAGRVGDIDLTVVVAEPDPRIL